MYFSKMINSVKQKPGLFLCVFSLCVLFFLILPLNLSVICANENQGFAFTWGEALLRWKELACGRGILFVLLYSLVLKVFGFNSYSIVAIHIIETVVLFLIGILIYLIVKQALRNDLYGGLAVLFWVIFVCTPIGMSDLIVELASHYNLNEENLCVLFSLFSLFCLLVSGLFNAEQSLMPSIKEKLFSAFAGIFAICSMMSKANGAILLIATLIWFLLNFFIRNEYFKYAIKKTQYYFFGLLGSLLFFNIVLYVLNGDLLTTWRDYFLLGNYTNEHLNSCKLLFANFFYFMTRHTNSISNFILFFFILLLLLFGLIRNFVKRNDLSNISNFWLLISLWGIGNVCAIVAPGTYQPYYYHLIWSVAAILLSFGLYELFLKFSGKKIFLALIILFVIVFFFCRIGVTVPSHYKLTKALNALSVFKQPQSFQDPVLPYVAKTSVRPRIFQLADLVNRLLPDKDSTFYIVDFSQKGFIAFTPLSYIYAKRYPPTSVDAGLLGVPTILKSKLKILQRDLSRRKPEIIILSKTISLQPWQVQDLTPFVQWLTGVIKEEYRYETYVNLLMKNDQQETFFILRKIK